MGHTVSLYLRYMGISVRGQMQYRGSFVMQSLGQLLVTAIDFLAIWALFARFGSLRGWRLEEVALLYGMTNISFAFSDAAARGFELFGNTVKAGDFDRILLRPRGTALQVAAQEFTLRRVGRFLQGAAILAWAIVELGGLAPARWALLLAAILGGACFFYGLVVLQGATAFWTTETLELFHILTYGGTLATQYPMTIYRAWFRRFFTFVIPLASVNYLPGVAVLGRADPLGAPAAVQWLSPLMGVAFLVAALRLWNFGVRRYVSTGS